MRQESPPAWTQEAYRPLCSKYSLCCPNWVSPPARVPPSQGTPQPGYPPWPGYPPARVPLQPGYPLPPLGPGYPPARIPPQLDLAGYPPAAPWHSGKCCKALWDMGTPPVDRQIDGWMEGQTRVKTLPSRRTTYAGGKNQFSKGGGGDPETDI